MQKSIKRTLAIFLVIVMMVTAAPLTGFASDTQGGLVGKIGSALSGVKLGVSISTPKQVYNEDESIVFSITVINKGLTRVDNVYLRNYSHLHLKLADEQKRIEVGTLAAGESKTFTLNAEYQNEPYSSLASKIYMRFVTPIYETLFTAFSSFIVPNFIVNAATKNIHMESVDKDYGIITIASAGDDDEPTTESTEPEDPTNPETNDKDGDGLTDDDEAIFGTDPNNADTDGDGFTDYEELRFMGTDPLTKNDGSIDTDSDGLSDYDEVKKYKTDINSNDTDSDDLSDYDEVNKYGTNPTKKDTDGDGLSDSFEIKNGLDPTKASTDGITNDADLKINQVIDKKAVSDSLLDDDNEAKPSVKGEATGELADNVFLATSSSSDLDDNRAVIGKAVLVDGNDDYIDGLNLEFDVSGYKGNLTYLSVCILNEDGTIELIESQRDESTLSCVMERSATYFVMDTEAFLKGLDIDLNEYVPEKAKMRSITKSAEIANDKVSGQADIVFAIDTTGSMSDEIYNVKENVADFTERLATEYNVKVNYALIDFRDLEEDGPGTTKVIKNGSSNWYNDVTVYKSALNRLSADGGGDTPECDVDALETARRLDFRKSASKFIILITDADYKVLNDYGIKSMGEEIALLLADDINVSVVTSSYYASLYESLYTTTGGMYANINGNFSVELLKLADLIGETTSDGEWVILKRGYRYVKLDAIPESGSDVDTDADGITDYVELGSTQVIDLTPFIRFQLLIKGVPFEEYSGKTSITVYDSIADPTIDDTDADGFIDSEDTTPWKAVAFKTIEKYIAHKFENNPSVTLLVKQPIIGDRVAVNFNGDDLVGHSFILLSDGNGNFVFRGFYPDFEGTEFENKVKPYVDYAVENIYTRGILSTNGQIGNDESHKYNIGYCSKITYDDYEKVLSYINEHGEDSYNLQKYNCTTFAVEAFAEAQNNIKSVIKKHLWNIPWWAVWATAPVFLPYGYDPGDAGEDIRANASEYIAKASVMLTDGSTFSGAIVEKH